LEALDVEELELEDELELDEAELLLELLLLLLLEALEELLSLLDLLSFLSSTLRKNKPH
jgi:hypothetical protein